MCMYEILLLFCHGILIMYSEYVRMYICTYEDTGSLCTVNMYICTYV